MLSPHPHVADTQANSEDETEQSSTQPPSGEDKDGDKGEDKGETKGEDNGEDNLNEVLWAGFTQKRMAFRFTKVSTSHPLALFTQKEPHFAPDMFYRAFPSWTLVSTAS